MFLDIPPEETEGLRCVEKRLRCVGSEESAEQLEEILVGSQGAVVQTVRAGFGGGTGGPDCGVT